MRNDQEIFNDIGAVLLAIAPDNAQQVTVNAKLESENDCGEFTYDYIDKKGAEYWVDDTKNASEMLLDLFVELRTYFVDNFKSEEKPFWHGCKVTVDVENLKIHIDFKYD